MNKNEQQKIIVYNVPSHTTIDIVQGRNYNFIGDSIMNQEGFLRNFHIKPARVLHRITATNSLTNIQYQNDFIITKNKIIAIVDAPINYVGNKINVDAIIVTKNPKLYISQLQQVFNCKQIIFDGSNPSWKLNYWKKDCDSLHLPYHICALQGAFEMDL